MFCIYKFRSMRIDAEERKAEVADLNKHLADGGDARMFKIPDDPRVTRFGSFVRRYSLDELPQLINVLKGDMSLVGPRPLILEDPVRRDGHARLPVRDQLVDDGRREAHPSHDPRAVPVTLGLSPVRNGPR